MTEIDTYTKYKEQKSIFEKELRKQVQLLENRTEDVGFKKAKEYHKNLGKLQKEFKKLLRSFTSVQEKSISLDKYSGELKMIRKYTTTVEGLIKIANTSYMRTTMPREETEVYDYFSGIDSDVSYICKLIKRNSQVVSMEEEEVIMLIHNILKNKKEITRKIIRSTIKKPKATLNLDNYSGGDLLYQLRSEQITLKHLLKEEKDYDVIKDYEERLMLIEEQIKLARKEIIKEKAEKRGMRK